MPHEALTSPDRPPPHPRCRKVKRHIGTSLNQRNHPQAALEHPTQTSTATREPRQPNRCLELANEHEEDDEENPMHHQDHTPSAPAKVVDPVCGMKIDPASAAASREHDGKTFSFCSPGCVATFDNNPAHYATH